MKIAVTAANGKLGSSVIRQLIQDVGKDQVIGIARTPEKAEHLDIEVRKGDYDTDEDFVKALQGVDSLLMISGLADPGTRMQQHRNIIAGAKKNDVRKIVYTSILGHSDKTGFAPVVRSMRQTEKDVQNSGMEWVVGRNGMYMEADLAYVDQYQELGYISNSASNGKSSYTSYPELGRAYSQLLTEDSLNNRIYQLTGTPISQSELAELINQHFKTALRYQTVSAADFYQEKTNAYGDFFGNIVGGIYEGISQGLYEVPSDFEKILGRSHKSPEEIVKEFQNKVSQV